MGRPIWLDHSLLAAVDAVYAAIPRPRPARGRLQNAKIIAHRGETLGDNSIENTMRAFENALECGCWGVEFDIRFTRDGVAVIHHDSTLARIHGVRLVIENSTLNELKSSAPSLLTLEEALARLAGRIHMMIEVKARPGGFLPSHVDELERRLKSVKAQRDFHLIALDENVLESFSFVPREAKLPVSELNPAHFSRIALERSYGGLTGHYLFLNNALRERHARVDQKIGTGFIQSRNCLFRELNRGVEWIFTNDARRLMNILRQSLAESLLD